MNKKEKYSYVLNVFERNNPDPTTELHYSNNFELLVAVMLSAQCTDQRVNKVTPALFKEMPTAKEMAVHEPSTIYNYIKSISYPNTKAIHLNQMANEIIEKHDGNIPESFEELIQLSGVGRKTANVIEAIAFNKPAMPVDTHVFRVSNRIGLTHHSKTPYETEIELKKNIPEEKLIKAHHWLILHGRYLCKAINPKCKECELKSVCDYFKKEAKANS